MSSEDAAQRTSASSTRSSSSRSKQNPQQQLSTIEKSVTHLLVATKQLLETLTAWSTSRATENEVSDVYVRLGYEFNIACRAFNAIGVDTTDLGPVPDMLRTILEETLSQEASQQSLERYLPKIRDIIINLLHGLKKKQQRLRQKSNKDGETSRPVRQSSATSAIGGETGTTQPPDDVPVRQSSARPYSTRQLSGDISGQDLPPRTTSAASGRQSPRRHELSPQNSFSNTVHDQINTDSASSSSFNSTMQNIPVITPYPDENMIPDGHTEPPRPPPQLPDPPLPPPPASNNLAIPRPPIRGGTSHDNPNDALSALQRGGDLERRASRRFSAYQIQRHLGGVAAISALPPPQNSPVPNRGRHDARESLSAVRSRGSVLAPKSGQSHIRAKSRGQLSQTSGLDSSPSRGAESVARIEEEHSVSSSTSSLPRTADTHALPDPPRMPAAASEEELVDSPTVKTPEDKLGSYPFPEEKRTQAPVQEDGSLGATLRGPLLDQPFVQQEGGAEGGEDLTPQTEFVPVRSERAARVRQAREYTPPVSLQFVPDGSPQAGRELTVFLQYKSKIKKFVFPDGGDITIPRLQLAFIEKFAWNTHNNGVDLPEIYIQDQISGVRHELEDLSDVKERSVLVLNVEVLDEVKRHFDEGIGEVRRIVEGIRTNVEDQHSALQRVSDRQQETAKELAGLAAAPPVAPTIITSPTTSGAAPISNKTKADQLLEVQALRRDLAVVRQTYNSFVSDINASMATLRTKAAGVKKAAADSQVPSMDNTSGRAYVNNGKKALSEDSERIVNRVDDLQDLVEDLRKDVVTRGVRPLPRQLESVSKDISIVTAELKKMQEFLKKEKPIWTKIWEKELQVVCDDRDLLTMQEELATDLEDDLEKAAATFALVEQATKQQNLQNPTGANGTAVTGFTLGSRSTSRNLNPISADPHKAKDSVLGEVRALQPNHESRLEAIERAERARQRELENRRGGEFQRELGNFVEEGKLKKSGGVEEVERIRKVREEKTRKEVYERQQERMRAAAEREAAAAAAAAAAVATTEAAGQSTAGQTSELLGWNAGAGDGSANHDAGHTIEGSRGSSPDIPFVEAKEEVSSPTG